MILAGDRQHTEPGTIAWHDEQVVGTTRHAVVGVAVVGVAVVGIAVVGVAVAPRPAGCTGKFTCQRAGKKQAPSTGRPGSGGIVRSVHRSCAKAD